MKRSLFIFQIFCFGIVALSLAGTRPLMAEDAPEAPVLLEQDVPPPVLSDQAPDENLSPVAEVPSTGSADAPDEAAGGETIAPVVAAPDSPEATPPSLSQVLGMAEDDAADKNAANGQMGAPMGALPIAADQKSEADQALTERKDAFQGAVDSLMPLKPSEIRRILELYDETSQAVETPVYSDPEPESSFVQASLEPGAKPVLIKTAVGNVTTLSIVDVTGQPWPIQDLTWAGDFSVEQPDSGSHIVRITPQSHFAQGNISMRLLGLNPPVIFTLKTERKTVHVRLDVQIPEVGPKGVLPPVLTPVSIKAGDDDLSKVLVGTPSSAGMTKLSVDGVDGRTTAYSKGGMTYIRTPYTLLSPAWMKSVQSADGMHVYALDNTPVLLLSDKGKMLRAYLSPMEQTNGQ